MKIWLDDVRKPPDESWVWAKNHDEFRWHAGAPDSVDEIDFDHDLGDDSESGSWCASFYISKVFECGHKFCRWSIHSSNPDGAKNIAAKMASAEKMIRQSFSWEE